ncbi:beta-ketoacyl synthase N-terminal-like domain-containing protein [Variovorax sp. OV329]|uniref:beta-ketoacyl synthase N-terminal-like domain-containing protein n=1 Tax=Variovorax sp. OV329 TaxID=1882825 RepID=UPI0008F07130|nr:beta-ketoacyl synthase N-terminal-like domain-containing protein [Variovorax sp. OV329]SFM81126.1 3-oxoacyl-[acyl-carrier-protein] synthase-1 [Variovorax sp. OV329]
MDFEPVFIVALGASTPVGRDAWASAAAVRAGISGFGEHPFIIDAAGEPVRVARAPWLEPELPAADRMLAMLQPAVDQALVPLAGMPAAGLRVALSLGLPAVRPGVAADLPQLLASAAAQRWRGQVSAVARFAAGHAAGLFALEAAWTRLAQGALDACVVAGVDSYIDADALEWLEQGEQLHGAGPLNNAWGFVPGEGAGAVLLMRRSLVERLQLPALARLLGVGSAFEPKRIKTETICVGEGLTQAFRSALAGLPGSHRVSDVYCDMNGEPYRADEFGFAVLRTKEAFESASDFIAPADCWGDLAAAGGPLHLALAVAAGHKSYANGPLAFVWGSAEGGERAAALLAVGAGS